MESVRALRVCDATEIGQAWNVVLLWSFARNGLRGGLLPPWPQVALAPRRTTHNTRWCIVVPHATANIYRRNIVLIEPCYSFHATIEYFDHPCSRPMRRGMRLARVDENCCSEYGCWNVPLCLADRMELSGVRRKFRATRRSKTRYSACRRAVGPGTQLSRCDLLLVSLGRARFC